MRTVAEALKRLDRWDAQPTHRFVTSIDPDTGERTQVAVPLAQWVSDLMKVVNAADREQDRTGSGNG